MNCAYHSQNVAVVQCNGCGRALCPACDHRIKGFPYCQDCIVLGVDLLRQRSQASYVPFIKNHTSPFFALVLSICPGLGSAYNGQTVKALVHFGVFVGLFQMAILTRGPGTVLFVFGFIGMWLFAALDAWRTARMIRSGLTPDIAEDIFVKRFSGNPKLWGIVLSVLGAGFLLRNVLPNGLMRGLLPLMLIGLGVYILRGHIFKPKAETSGFGDFENPRPVPMFVSGAGESSYRHEEQDQREDYSRGSKAGGWGNRS